jgi:hypothetical protein
MGWRLGARLSAAGQTQPPSFVAATAELPSIADAGEAWRGPRRSATSCRRAASPWGRRETRRIATMMRVLSTFSVRPEASWWTSFLDTIGALFSAPDQVPLPPHLRTMRDVAIEMIQVQTFGCPPTARACWPPTAAAPRKCAPPSQRSGCWCSTSPKAGRRCAASSTCRCRTRRSRA